MHGWSLFCLVDSTPFFCEDEELETLEERLVESTSPKCSMSVGFVEVAHLSITPVARKRADVHGLG